MNWPFGASYGEMNVLRENNINVERSTNLTRSFNSFKFLRIYKMPNSKSYKDRDITSDN